MDNNNIEPLGTDIPSIKVPNELKPVDVPNKPILDVEIKSKDAIPIIKEFLRNEGLQIITGKSMGIGMWIRIIILLGILITIIF